MQNRDGSSNKEEKLMLLSDQTLLGLKVRGLVNSLLCVCLCFTLPSLLTCAVKSFVELVKYLISVPRVKVFLSETPQDPLENLFGIQCQWERTFVITHKPFMSLRLSLLKETAEERSQNLWTYRKRNMPLPQYTRT